MSNDRFAGKTALITGASSGIGRATALRFSAEGAKVGVTARRAELLESLISEVHEAGGTAYAIAADLTSEGDRQSLIEEFTGQYGNIDVLVNSAGIIDFGTIETTSLEDWQKMFDINVVSVFRLMQLALPHMLSNKGNIVNVSSVNGSRQFPNLLAYNTSKSAVDQITCSAAIELAPKGIRVNSVNPGVTVTGLHRQGGLDEEKYSNFLEHSKTTHPIGRVGNADEVAALIAFLSSDEAGFITGDNIYIDGGRHLTCAR